MKSTKTVFVIALTLAALTAGAWAENPGSGAPAASAANPAPAPTVVTAADVQALKEALAAQQLQIQRLTEQLERQQAWQSQQSAAAAAARIDAAPTQPAPQQLAALNTGAAVEPSAVQGSAPSTQEVKNVSPEWETPMSIHLKGVTITPGGFVAAEFVRRSRELGADVVTPFNNLTMPGASQNNLSEFFGSGRQSRPTIFVGGKMKDVELSSYVSGDFLSSGTTSNSNQTDGYTLRLRQAWGQAKFNNGWKFLGGQAWSLVTENKLGIAPSDDTGRVNDARPATIDGQYNVGFTFARQYGLRLTKDFTNGLSVAFSMENAQGTLATSNNAANFLLGQAGATNVNNAFNGTYTANPAPDLVAKVAYDQGHGHYEIFGLADRFTDRIFPCVEPGTNLICVGGTTATGAYNASKEGGGFGFNARWTLLDKRVVFGLHEFGGTGVGRYGAAGLPDLAIHANGTLNLIRNNQGLGTLEFHGKKLDIYSYAGVEYAGRAYDFDPNLNAAGTGPVGYVGYGAPAFSNAGCYTELSPAVNTGFTPTGLARCTAQTRVIMEGTVGFWYRFYNGPKGRFQFGTQYSYVTRHTWYGVAGPGTSTQPSGLDNMVFTSFRYYLP